MTLYQQQSKNMRKTWALVLVFALVVIGLGWFLSYYFGDPSILYIAVMFALFMNVGSYWFSHKIVVSISGAKEAGPEHREISNMLENLAISQGMQKPKLYVIADPTPNAFATGRNEKHAVVAVTTGLVSLLEKNELEGVLAHELAHIKNKDMLLSTMVVVLVGFVSLIADMFLRGMIFGGGGGDRDNKAGGILMIVGIVLVILSPVIAQLIHFAISRKREFVADATGALMTRYPEGLAGALQKIETYSQSRGGQMRRANHAMAHMYISNPFGAKALKGWNKMWSTHPPTQDRIKALLSGQA